MFIHFNMKEEIQKLKRISKGIHNEPSKNQLSKISDVLKTIKKKYKEQYVVVIRKVTKK